MERIASLLQRNRHQAAGCAFLIPAVLALLNLLGEAGPADNAIFAYLGHCVGEGAVPYLELWDTKGPLQFWLNALGMLGGRVGHTLFGAVVAWVTLLCLLRAWGRWYGATAAAWALPAVVVYAAYADGGTRGNMTEAHALALAAGILCLQSLSVRGLWVAVAQGLSVGCLLMLKGNYIGPGVWLAACWWMQGELGFRRVAAAAGGFLLGVGIPLAVIAGQGAFADYADACFRYTSMEYNRGTPYFLCLVRHLYRTLPWLTLPVLCLLPLLLRNLRRVSAPTRAAALWFAVEVAATSTADSFYPHYLVPAVLPGFMTALGLWHSGVLRGWPLRAAVAAMAVGPLCLGIYLLRVQRHNLWVGAPESEAAAQAARRFGPQPVVLLGGSAVCRAALAGDMLPANRYVAGVTNYLQTQNPERRRKIALDAAAAMRRPGVRLLLAEAPPEQLPYMQTPEFAEAAAEWRPVACAGNIRFYAKKAP